MDTVFIRALFDLDCEWEGIQPIYRIYVNDELFVERTWAWTDCYLVEHLQIQAAPGEYKVRLETVGPNLAKFKTSNHRVVAGPGRWIDSNTLSIEHESQ